MSSAPASDKIRDSREEFSSPVGVEQSAIGRHEGVGYRLIACILWAMMLAFSYGFAVAMIASSLGQPNFYVYFNLATKTNLTQIIGAIVSLLTVGGIFGVIMCAYLQDKIGRKKALMVNALFHLLGTALSAGSVNITMFILARFILGIGTWSQILGTIVYSQELAPATRRGVLGGAIGAAITTGYFLAAWVGVGFFNVHEDWNWRVPVALPGFAPIVGMIFYPWVVESPRWLVAKGRYDEALEVLKLLHGSPSDPTFVLAREEHFQIVKQHELDQHVPSSWGSMLTVYRNRTVAILILTFFYMMTGIQIISNYGPTIYAGVGFSALDSLLIAGGTSTFNWILSWVCAGLVDRTGRRAMLFFSISGSGIMLIPITGLLSRFEVTGDPALGKAIVGLFYVYLIFFSFSEPVVYIYMGEIFPTQVRTKGIAIANIMICVQSVWITMGQPTAQAKIGYKFYLIFIILGTLGGGFLYWYLPETKNISLEEIPALFGDEVAVRAADLAVNDNDVIVEKRGA